MEPVRKQGPVKEIQPGLSHIMAHKYRERSSREGRASGRPADARKLRKSTAELISRSLPLLLLPLEQRASANNARDESFSWKIGTAQPLLKVGINLAAIQVTCSPCVYHQKGGEMAERMEMLRAKVAEH